MSDKAVIEQVNDGIESLLAGNDSGPLAVDPEAAELLALAEELRCLPSPEFKDRLMSKLVDEAERRSSVTTSVAAEDDDAHETLRYMIPTAQPRSSRRELLVPSEILPTLFSSGAEAYPVRRANFMASLAAHAAAIALVVTSGIWAAQKERPQPRVHSVLVMDIGAVLPPSADQTRGGGGGGDHDKLLAPQGAPPRFAHQQIVPPALVVRNEQPKVTAEPTVIGPPELSFPQTSRLGDPYSSVGGPLSNGIGSRGGIGTGDSLGVGPGSGPGVGDGWGGGFGHGPYRVGGGVTAPRPVYDPEPEYSEEARKIKQQGVVVLQVIVGADGRTRNVRVARSLGLGLDEKAIAAVTQWRFEPGTMDGRPVPVVINVEVNFRLY